MAKSAYAVLGIPGNATPEEIREAFQQARGRYTQEMLLADAAAMDRYNELREAYKVLSSPELRAMHDRKLSLAVTPRNAGPRVVVEQDGSSSAASILKIIALVTVILFAIGVYYTHQRAEERRIQFEREQAEQKREREEAAKAEELAKAQEAERRRANAIADFKEHAMRIESASIARQQLSNQTAAIAAQQRQDMMQKSAADQAERQRRYEAQQRAADTQRQLQNLCMQNYGRPNC